MRARLVLVEVCESLDITLCFFVGGVVVRGGSLRTRLNCVQNEVVCDVTDLFDGVFHAPARKSIECTAAHIMATSEPATTATTATATPTQAVAPPKPPSTYLTFTPSGASWIVAALLIASL